MLVLQLQHASGECRLILTVLAIVVRLQCFTGDGVTGQHLSLVLRVAGFVDFCLGCVFFAWGIRFKVFPKSLYAVSISEKPDMKWTWNDTNKRLNEGAATEGSKCAATPWLAHVQNKPCRPSAS